LHLDNGIDKYQVMPIGLEAIKQKNKETKKRTSKQTNKQIIR
jgi:hypothetical protein